MMMLWSCAGQAPDDLGVTDGRLAPCPSSPNCVSSDAADADHLVAPYALAAEAAPSWVIVREVIAAYPRTTIVTADDDYLHGGAGDDLLDGGSGDDRLDGGGAADQLFGLDGDDELIGGLGRDELTGNEGADRFVWNDIADSGVLNADQLLDFRAYERDKLDVSGIDANNNTADDDAFAFIEDDPFSGSAGELRYYQTPGLETVVEADVNGDAVADMQIVLRGGPDTLGVDDFLGVMA